MKKIKDFVTKWYPMMITLVGTFLITINMLLCWDHWWEDTEVPEEMQTSIVKIIKARIGI